MKIIIKFKHKKRHSFERLCIPYYIYKDLLLSHRQWPIAKARDWDWLFIKR